MKKSFPLSKVYGLLEPGPVVLVTTAQKGRANVMTLSWLTMMDFEPPRPTFLLLYRLLRAEEGIKHKARNSGLCV